MKLWSLWRRATRTAQPARTRLNLEAMEARDVPSAAPDPFVAVPTYSPGHDSTVQLVSAVDGSARIGPIDAFPGYTGPLSVAVGDVNGDGIGDLIVGAQAPNGHVKVFDGATGTLLQSFYSFPGFNGTVSVGAADVNGDGHADILVGANGAANSHIKAFSGADGSLLSSFFAFPGFNGSVAVTGADFNGSGHAQIVVGAGGQGIGGRVAIFNPDGSISNPGFFAFPGYNGSITVAAGDVTGSGIPDIIVGAGPGAPGGQVEVFRGTDFAPLSGFVPYAPNVTAGVNVQLADTNQDGILDVQVTLLSGGISSLESFSGATGQSFTPPATQDTSTPDTSGSSGFNFGNVTDNFDFSGITM
jgi:hypothetical protein